MADAKTSKSSLTSAEEFLSRADLKVKIIDEITKDQLCAVAQTLGVKVFGGEKKSFLNRTVCNASFQYGLIESDVSMTDPNKLKLKSPPPTEVWMGSTNEYLPVESNY